VVNQFGGCSRFLPRGDQLLDHIPSSSLQVLATEGSTNFPSDARRSPTAIDIVIYKGISSCFLTAHESNELSSDDIPLEILLCAAASRKLNTARLLSRRANIGRFKDHLTILIENDESADLSCPLDTNAAVTDLIQSDAAASTANGNHSAVPQLNDDL